MKNQLLITATSVDGVSHGIPYPMPLLSPIWVTLSAITNAHRSGRVTITLYNTNEPTVLTDAILAQLLESSSVKGDTPIIIEPVKEEVKVEEPVKEEVVEETKEEEVVEPVKEPVEETKEEEVPPVVEEEKKFRKSSKK